MFAARPPLDYPACNFFSVFTSVVHVATFSGVLMGGRVSGIDYR
jgi:hypothetical protein